jgi:hypothetical protein
MFGWSNTASGLNYAVKLFGSLAQRTPDLRDRLASLVSAPEFFALRLCDCRGTPWSHAKHLLS